MRNGNAKASATVDRANGPSTALPTSLKLEATQASAGNEAGVTNVGFWGIPVLAQTTYKFSLYAKVAGDVGSVRARLVSDQTGAALAETTVKLHGDGWTRYEATLATGAVTPSTKNHLELTVAHSGTVWMQLVSLMPPTYHNRPNGLRIDLMEKMAAMHPTLRSAAGWQLSGRRHGWRIGTTGRKTIGPIVDRPGSSGALVVLVDRWAGACWSFWSGPKT